MRYTRRSFLTLTLAIALIASAGAQQLTVPNKPDSLKFAAIGDSGSGDDGQYKIGKQLGDMRSRFKFEFVVMMGDNIYGSDSPRDMKRKFEDPYKGILDAGVKFYASLGNHDQPKNQQLYKPFNMNGEAYYTFKPKEGIRFFALDSNYMDPKQLQWLEKELAASGSDWKIAFFHHPIYSSGRTHGSDTGLRERLEPLFVKYGVDVVLAGHEHFYERIKPQKGVYYFISGGAGKLRRGDIRRDALFEKGFDTGYHFMLMEIAGDELHFQAISDASQTVDSGVITRRRNDTKTNAPAPVRPVGTGGK
jgi:DNA repair exonuclease SbcCD nuclease subunit